MGGTKPEGDEVQRCHGARENHQVRHTRISIWNVFDVCNCFGFESCAFAAGYLAGWPKDDSKKIDIP